MKRLGKILIIVCSLLLLGVTCWILTQPGPLPSLAEHTATPVVVPDTAAPQALIQ
jgi:hypothetical protein